jgi:prepilin-type N-terminal cleavage/methylation domain-containing protein
MRPGSNGFTLIEAIAAVALMAIGICATLDGLAAISKAQARAMESELMQRLAFRKYDEILSEALLDSGSTSGDFKDIGENRFLWSAERTSTGDGNLDSLVVRVTRAGKNSDKGAFIEGLICRPSTKTSNATNGPGGAPTTGVPPSGNNLTGNPAGGGQP